MATAHIESKKEDIKKKVLMPGDPLRAKYIADHFLTDVKCVNEVRGMLAFTGKYKDKEITVFASGMGGPSIGIYAYELYHFYDVEKIIRIGTCGSNHESVKVRDMIVADQAYTLSSYPKLFFNDDTKMFSATKEITKALAEQATKMNVPTHVGTSITSDVFDVYVNKEEYNKNYPTDLQAIAVEMEAAILFALASHLQKEAACILTVVDSMYDPQVVTPEERQNSLNDMILCALETI